MADRQTLDLRRRFRLQLVQNPNHYGNLTDLDLPGLPDPALKLVSDTTFEELTCIGYNPATEMLTAIVEVKEEPATAAPTARVSTSGSTSTTATVSGSTAA